MRIVFFGTDDFAAKHLESLIDFYEVMACVIPPDQPKGRGMNIVFSRVKECALKNNIPVYQPPSLNDTAIIEQLKNLTADLFIVIAYGRILPSEILAIPKKGCLNVHPSLLPKYRGAAPINRVIIQGEKETGISIILMNALMDAGDIVAQTKISILPEDTSITLRTKMMGKGPGFLLETLKLFQENRCTLIKQDSKLVTLAPKLTKELGRIDWKNTASEIHDLVRGLLPWPSAYTFYQQKLLKILASEILELKNAQCQPADRGEVIEINKQGFVVAAGKGGLLVKHVHPQDARPMDAASFVRGCGLKVGYKFNPDFATEI